MIISGTSLELDKVLLVHLDKEILYATTNKDDAFTKLDAAKKKYPSKDFRISTVHNYGRICWGKGHGLSVN